MADKAPIDAALERNPRAYRSDKPQGMQNSFAETIDESERQERIALALIESAGSYGLSNDAISKGLVRQDALQRLARKGEVSTAKVWPHNWIRVRKRG